MTEAHLPAAPACAPALGLGIGPLQYWWPRPAVLDFYARVADSPAETVVLGEVVCSRRHEFKPADWLALARELRQAGKEVALASLVLVSGAAEWRGVRELAAQGEFAVEAGDASALQALAGSATPLILGPHLNIYSRDALLEHAGPTTRRWVAAAELPLAAVARINPPRQRVAGAGGAVATEVFAYGRLPLSFSARCFTARHHRLSKDACEFRCRDDADGLRVDSSEGQPFLCINGTQVQSAGCHALVAAPAALRAAGVDRLRLSPTSRGFFDAVAVFDALRRDALDCAGARAALRAIDHPGPLVDGYARGAVGMATVEPELHAPAH